MREIRGMTIPDTCSCGRMAGHKGACGFGREEPAVIRPEEAPQLLRAPSADELLNLHGLEAFNRALREHEVVTDRDAIAAAMADVEPDPAEPWLSPAARVYDRTGVVGLAEFIPHAPTERVLADIAAERRRQVQLRDAGRFRHTIADAGMADVSRLAALTEELGEVARALQERLGSVTDKHGGDLRKELIQVAAIATGWCERLDADAEGGQ